MGFTFRQFEIVFRHDTDELLKTDFRLPVQIIECLGESPHRESTSVA